MFHKPFETEEEKEYHIVNSYFSSESGNKGLYFLVQNEESGEIKCFFLKKENMNDLFLPKKVKESDVKYEASGILLGKTNKLIVKEGYWEKQGMFNKTKVVKGRIYKYIMKKG